MNLKPIILSLSVLFITTGCSSLKPANQITGSNLLTKNELILKDSLGLISLHATEKSANKSLKAVQSCGLKKGDILTINQLKKLESVHLESYNKCWNNVKAYMKNGDPRVKKGGTNYELASKFNSTWAKK